MPETRPILSIMCSSVVYVHTGRTPSEVAEYRCEDDSNEHQLHYATIRSRAVTRTLTTDRGVRTHSGGRGRRQEYGPSSDAAVQIRWYARTSATQ